MARTSKMQKVLKQIKNGGRSTFCSCRQVVGSDIPGLLNCCGASISAQDFRDPCSIPHCTTNQLLLLARSTVLITGGCMICWLKDTKILKCS